MKAGKKFSPGQLVSVNLKNPDLLWPPTFRRVMLNKVNYNDETQWVYVPDSSIGIVISTKLNNEQLKERRFVDTAATIVVLMGEELVYAESDELLLLEGEE